MYTPRDVARERQDTYHNNLNAITRGTQRLAMFSADQKIEHLNGVSPEKLFTIASSHHMGAFATHLGLIHRYAPYYDAINYIVKMNGSTNLRSTEFGDPYSRALWSLDHVMHTHHTTATIRGIGYTVYLGSAYESWMLKEAAHLTLHAHQEGLVPIIWMYPRGKAVHDESDPHTIIGAAAAATSIGCDFAKVKTPYGDAETSARHLTQVVASAGNTRIICSGGPPQEPKQFLYQLYTQIHTGITAGCAVGRNIFTRKTEEAIAMTKAISSIIYDDTTYEKAYRNWHEQFT